MARPEVYPERLKTAFRCPPDLLAEAKRSAADHDIGFNLWLERAMRHYLAHLGGDEQAAPWSWSKG